MTQLVDLTVPFSCTIADCGALSFTDTDNAVGNVATVATTFGTVNVATCRALQYTPTGDGMSGVYVCGHDGAWSSGDTSSALICEISSRNYAGQSSQQVTYEYCVGVGGCDCLPGYLSKDESQFLDLQTVTCDMITCPALTLPSNANWIGSCYTSAYGTECIMACDAGYDAIGSATYACGLDPYHCGTTPVAGATVTSSTNSPTSGNLADGDTTTSWSSTALPVW